LPSSPRQNWEALKNQARLTLGLIFYEIGDFKKALDYLKDVSPGDESYKYALLGLAWTYIKLGLHHKAVPPLEEFLKKFPESEHVPEAYFLLGQCHLKIRLYDKSIAYFQKIFDLFPGQPNNNATLVRVRNQIAREKRRLQEIQTNLLILEMRFLGTIKMPPQGYVPNFMEEEIRKVEAARAKLLTKIRGERENLERLNQELEALQRAVNQRTLDWRSYAEYGISRALFMKERE